MSQTVAELLDAALALPEAERAELAELIEATIAAPPSSLHPNWAEEFRRRAADVKSGQAQPIPLDEVQKRVQAQLAAGGSKNG